MFKIVILNFINNNIYHCRKNMYLVLKIYNDSELLNVNKLKKNFKK